MMAATVRWGWAPEPVCVPCSGGTSGPRRANGLAETVEGNGQQGDGDARLQPGTDGQALERGKHVEAETARADHGRR